MVCPNCNSSDYKVLDTISRQNDIYRQKKCNNCGKKFFSKEIYVNQDEAAPLFTEWSRERSRKSRAKKKGMSYDVKFADGRENPVETKQPTSPLF